MPSLAFYRTRIRDARNRVSDRLMGIVDRSPALARYGDPGGIAIYSSSIFWWYCSVFTDNRNDELAFVLEHERRFRGA
jgi:hypothetical protein